MSRRTTVLTVVALAAFTALGGALAFVLLSRPSATSGVDKTDSANATTALTALPAASMQVVENAPAGDGLPAVAASGEASGPSTPPTGKTTTSRKTNPVPPPPPPPPVEESTEPGTLIVSVLPWADVTVDGKGVGTTPLAPISLAPGTHSVVLRNSELGASRSTAVTIKPGKPTSIRIDLRKTE
jgi:serine/threonine-protein kinase